MCEFVGSVFTQGCKLICHSDEVDFLGHVQYELIGHISWWVVVLVGGILPKRDAA
jgi:hypothetical protein